jgi:hypothetical protein
MRNTIVLLLTSVLAAGCTARATDMSAAAPAANPAHEAVAPSQRQVFFGDLHLHTTYSFDAWSLMGTKTTPDQAYKFARGETIQFMGKPVRRAWPLDFTAVTDHSENIGVMNQLDDPKSGFALSDLGRQIIKNPASAFYILKHAVDSHTPIPEMNAKPAMKATWDREMGAANANYEPGRFTTFIAYEWTSMAQGKYNLHRNVIFRNDHAPSPFTSADSGKPEDLWTYLEHARTIGFDVIAIPHNANVSGGLMFDWNMSDGRPIDEVYAQRRALNEPLTEIAQNKGVSETTPELSASDEFANFEIFDHLLTEPGVKSAPHGSYIREAYGRGLVIQAKVGANPFKMGLVGATDFHNGLSTSDENAFAGGPFGIDPNTTLPAGDAAKRALGLIPTPALIDEGAQAGAKPTLDDPTIFGSGGLTGVWAERNDRDAIFAALKRKETFATSGPRIKVRVFGGWTFGPGLLKRPDWVGIAYSTGVPMGGDLPARPAGARRPSFIIQAVKAPDSGNLDRVQVVKVWLDGAGYKEKVFDVAWSPERKLDPVTGRLPAVKNTVDLRTATYANTVGATVLSTVWSDPEFEAAKPAVYYVRVLEIPTPRWTTLLAVKRGLPLPSQRAATIQERAWASPIWYTPAPRQTTAVDRNHRGRA